MWCEDLTSFSIAEGTVTSTEVVETGAFTPPVAPGGPPLECFRDPRRGVNSPVQIDQILIQEALHLLGEWCGSPLLMLWLILDATCCHRNA